MNSFFYSSSYNEYKNGNLIDNSEESINYNNNKGSYTKSKFGNQLAHKNITKNDIDKYITITSSLRRAAAPGTREQLPESRERADTRGVVFVCEKEREKEKDDGIVLLRKQRGSPQRPRQSPPRTAT